jgi:hypothetical protein
MSDSSPRPASSLPTTIEFFFDPGCPWTWATSRWLVSATGQRDVAISWRILSLAVLNEGREIPEQYRSAMAAGRGFHRLVAALLADGERDLVGALYSEYGRRVHHDGASPSVEVVRAGATAAGAGAWLEALDQESWDEVLRASTDEAVGLAGPDVGSPVLAFDEPRLGIFGPIVSPPPAGDDAVRLLELVVDAARTPGFFELKRGRRTGPQPGPRP